MAYMDQEKKVKIAATLKKVVPASWKYSLAVRHHSTIVMTISSAPVDLLRAFKATPAYNPDLATHLDVNVYHFRDAIADVGILATFEKIIGALNLGNFDKSDPQTDYFHVGHYVDLDIGRWNKPFVINA